MQHPPKDDLHQQSSSYFIKNSSLQPTSRNQSCFSSLQNESSQYDFFSKTQKKPLRERRFEENLLTSHGSKKFIPNTKISPHSHCSQNCPSKTLKTKKSAKAARIYEVSDRSMTPENFFYYEQIANELSRNEGSYLEESLLCKFDREIGFPAKIECNKSIQTLSNKQSSMFKENENDYLLSKILSKKSSTTKQFLAVENSKYESDVFEKVYPKSQKRVSTKKKKEPKLIEKKEKALKKIKNRLKVCAVSYFENRDKNREAEYLKMRYENEGRAREELKRKVLEGREKKYKF